MDDFQCKAFACKRREAEMQATIDALRERVAGLEAKAARLDAAPVGVVVGGRANSYGGYHVEVAHDQGWHNGQRVRLVPEDASDAK